MDLRLKGKVVLVTGATKGIGLAAARGFAEEGCRVAVCARGQEGLDRTEQELADAGADVLAVQADLTDPDQAAACVARCVDRFGGLDILVNNVYAVVGGYTLLDSTDDDWRRTFEGVLFQAMRLIRLAAPHMRGRDGANVVNIGSLSGSSPQLAGATSYAAAKAGMIFLAERLALELHGHGIRVNTVSPGSTLGKDGPMERLYEEHPDMMKEFVSASLPAGRMGRPEEVADVVVFLASPRAGWVNGRHIPADGLQQPTPAGWMKVW